LYDEDEAEDIAEDEEVVVEKTNLALSNISVLSESQIGTDEGDNASLAYSGNSEDNNDVVTV
jgi:hypothetical protein